MQIKITWRFQFTQVRAVINKETRANASQDVEGKEPL